MLELIDINFKKNNKQILENINIKFDTSKVYVITGPNGSGKSTLCKIIMGLENPTSGKILYNGQDITNKKINERSKLGIGYAFQTPVLFKGISVFELLSIASNREISKKEACDILSKVGLCALDYIDRQIDGTLSGGELKRIEIASLIAKNPSIIIFDEPEAGIDLWSFDNLIEVFKILKKKNSTNIIISHQEKILNISDMVILLEDGKIKNFGKKKEVLKKIKTNKKCCGQVRIYE